MWGARRQGFLGPGWLGQGRQSQSLTPAWPPWCPSPPPSLPPSILNAHQAEGLRLGSSPQGMQAAYVFYPRLHWGHLFQRVSSPSHASQGPQGRDSPFPAPWPATPTLPQKMEHSSSPRGSAEDVCVLQEGAHSRRGGGVGRGGGAVGSSCRLVPSRGRPGWSRQPTMSSVPDLHSAGAFRALSSLCRLDLLLPIKRVSQEEPPSVCPRAHGASSLLWSQGPVPRSSLPSGNIQPWS